MNNILVDISGKLPQGLIETWSHVHLVAKQLNIPYVVVGATARDIIMVHGFNAQLERGTRDLDFGIQVATWQQFEQLKVALQARGFSVQRHKIHQLLYQDHQGLPWEIDIIPFGTLSNDESEISWPPGHDVVMTVLGFEESCCHAWSVTIDKLAGLTIPVASPAGMLLLKLVSWFERDHQSRRKDAADIFYLCRHYAKIPVILDVLYDDDYMTYFDYDELKASAQKLAHDAYSLATNETRHHILRQLSDVDLVIDQLTLEVSRFLPMKYQQIAEAFAVLLEVFQEVPGDES